MDYPVDNLDDAYNACHPDKPLESGDPRYLDLKDVRNKKSVNTLATRIIRTSQTEDFCKQLVTGHTGCGKSTELKRLQKHLENSSYFVIFLDVENSLDLHQITYQDVLLNIAQGVIEALAKQAINLDKGLLNDLDLLLAEKIVTHEYLTEAKASIGIDTQAGIDIFGIGKFITKIMGEVRSGSSHREQIRERIKGVQQEFIAKLNDLLIAARVKLKTKGHADIVFIVDGLEKIRESATYNDLFIEHAEQLNEIGAHVLYTIPIALAFNANLGDFFANDVFFMPMVKYQTPEGKQYLADLIDKRMQVALLFADPALLQRLIAMSGGSIRDLLRLIRIASETEESQIKDVDIDRAISHLVKEYDRLVKEEDVEFLKEIAAARRVIKDKDKRYERLLSLRLVNEYENGKPWADLHPALREISWLQAKLTAPN
ncbi:AAA family ATPase [Methylovulum psychrotolerans]|uniref:Uncharacterized protein n=1 Tax=Methylovulum psychrotolerans TaxID=1704499 RepID=A0A2S5CP53_9GAMM|nr:AAA family ATPase [Methylovulum psychrotolerans]POZ52593.1 hypothetical protein AADEFJLK_01195 [Methylovulum psychrotolerans]